MSTETGNGDLLRAGRSPQMLHRGGVRRLNYIPLFIVGGIAVVVALLIAWTAMERGKAGTVKSEDHGGNSRDFALAVAGDKAGYIPPAHVAPSATPPPPAASVPEAVPAATPPTNEEAEARKKAFFQALFATSGVSDPVMQQISNAHQQQISAEAAAKAVKADPNNLGGSTPGDIADYQRQAAAAQRMMGLNGGQPPGPPDPNNLATYNGYRDRWKLNTHVEAPATPYVLRSGAVIPALLLSAMNAELPGTIIAQVSEDVFDTPKGEFLLVPKGSRLVGEYSNAVQYGQSRIFVAWQRIIYPDGAALELGAMPGADQQGQGGFNDKVDNHFLRIFGSALLMSAITAATNWATNHNQGGFNNNGYSASSALSEAVGQQLGQATAHLLEKNLSIAPSLTIRSGFRFSVLVTKDLTFERPYVMPTY